MVMRTSTSWQASVDPALSVLLNAASYGDVAAQLDLVEHALAQCRVGAVTFEHAAHVAEAFARLAAAQGSQEARYKLASVIFYEAQVSVEAGRSEEAEHLICEAIVILDELADEGHEHATTALAGVGDRLPAELIASASKIVREGGWQGRGA